MHVQTHTRKICQIKFNMLTLHLANTRSTKAFPVSMVTGSSCVLNGQSSSSESARSTTTPGWRHWVGEMVVGETGCVCVCDREVDWVAFMCIIVLSQYFQRANNKHVEPLQVFTYVVNVRNVIFVHSNCLLNRKRVKNLKYHTALYIWMYF